MKGRALCNRALFGAAAVTGALALGLWASAPSQAAPSARGKSRGREPERTASAQGQAPRQREAAPKGDAPKLRAAALPSPARARALRARALAEGSPAETWRAARALVDRGCFRDAQEVARAAVARAPEHALSLDLERHLLIHPLDATPNPPEVVCFPPDSP